MNRKPISPRMVEYFVGMFATVMIATGLLLYALSEPSRITSAQALQLTSDLDGAMTLYAENCSVCHGLAGEGIGATPPLANTALASTDSEALVKIIARGLYGTAMPAWSVEDGGPLSDYQIGQLVSLIQAGDWQATQDRVVNLGLAPLVPFTTQPDPAILSSLEGLPEGALLVQGVQLFAEQCVACHGADGLGTSLAPALNDPAVRARTLDELERIIRLGVAGTLMAGWEKSLDDAQITAALELITRWEEVPLGAIPAPDRPVPTTAESLALGSELFTTSCARCHGPEGQGSQRAPSLNVSGFLSSTTDLAIQQIISLGVPGTAMPAWGDRLTDAEILAIVGFIRAWEPTAPEVAEPARVQGGPWWQTSAAAAGSTSPAGHTGATGTGAGQGQGANAQQQATIGWQIPEWRILLLIGLPSAIAVGMMLWGIRGLRRLAAP